MSLFTRKAKGNEITPKRQAPKIFTPSTIDGRKLAPAVGFSLLELERAGMSVEQAEDFGLRIDPDRLSALADNVNLLQRLLETL